MQENFEIEIANVESISDSELEKPDEEIKEEYIEPQTAQKNAEGMGERFFAIISKTLRILMGHIQPKNSLHSKLQFWSLCSNRILDIFEVMSFLKIPNQRHHCHFRHRR